MDLFKTLGECLQPENSPLIKSEISNVVFDSISTNPYIVTAFYFGKPMTERQLDCINEDQDFVNQKLISLLN